MPDRDMLELDLGQAILTSYDGSFLGAQFDSEGDDATDGDGTGGAQTASAEVHSPFGLDGRPRDPNANSDGTPGVGPTALRAIEGRKQHMFVYGDPRCTNVLPTLEKGSSRLYAHLSGDKVTWLRLDGSTGSAKLRVPIGAGESTVEVDGSTGNITLTHQGGTKVTISATTVEIGGAGAVAIARYPEVATFAASVAAFASAVVAAAAAGTLGAPIALPAVVPLSASAAATTGTVL